jgi:hypothetical protein
MRDQRQVLSNNDHNFVDVNNILDLHTFFNDQFHSIKNHTAMTDILTSTICGELTTTLHLAEE